MTTRGIRLLVLAFWLLLAGWVYWRNSETTLPETAAAGRDSSGIELFWFKGNTHSHARIVLQDYAHGDSSPAEVADWYSNHGYHFVSITDHNRYESSDGLVQPGEREPNLLVLPGMEVTGDHRYPGVNQQGERKIHSTALNIEGPVGWDFDDPDKSNIIRQQAERIRSMGGLHILNHPNYKFQLELPDLMAMDDAALFEMFNAHPRSNQSGHPGFRPGVEALWDQALSNGQLLYGVAADDAHDFGLLRKMLGKFGTAPPGGAWVMVKAPKVSPGHIVDAFQNGNFYASTGVHLSQVSTDRGRYEVVVDMERTLQEIQHRWVQAAAPVQWSDDSHLVIEFIGTHGRTLHTTHDETSSSIELDNNEAYIRAKISYLEKAPFLLNRDRARAYFAWTQPVMLKRQASAQ